MHGWSARFAWLCHLRLQRLRRLTFVKTVKRRAGFTDSVVTCYSVDRSDSKTVRRYAVDVSRAKGRKDVATQITMLREDLREKSDPTVVRMNLSPAQEAFAQALAKGMTQKQAAIEAGYSPHSAHVQGARLFAKAKVKQRVAQLQMSRLHDIDSARFDHIEQLVALRELAKDKGQIAAAIKAEELRGKVLGLYVEQSVRETVVSQKNFDAANEAELKEAIRKAIGSLGVLKDVVMIDGSLTED